ncbi:hypothetical protein MPJ33_002575 [Escherichia coli]|nr:hypothetical protein [Escherichia coli]
MFTRTRGNPLQFVIYLTDPPSFISCLIMHLHNEKGDEVTEVKRDYKGDDPTPAVG